MNQIGIERTVVLKRYTNKIIAEQHIYEILEKQVEEVKFKGAANDDLKFYRYK